MKRKRKETGKNGEQNHVIVGLHTSALVSLSLYQSSERHPHKDMVGPGTASREMFQRIYPIEIEIGYQVSSKHSYSLHPFHFPFPSSIYHDPTHPII